MRSCCPPRSGGSSWARGSGAWFGERGRAEDLHSPGALGRGGDSFDVEGAGLGEHALSGRLGGLAEERIHRSAAGRDEDEQTRHLGGDQIRVGHAGRNRNEATGGKRPLVTVEVDQRLPVEDVEGLLLGGVGVKRRRLALVGDLLQEQICPARLRARGLQCQQVVVEPKRLALAGIERDRRASLARLCRHDVLLDLLACCETIIS